MKLPGGVRRLLRVRESSRDVEEELDHHLTRAVEDLRAEGLSEWEARAEAERRFGDVARYRRDLVVLDRGRARALGWSLRAEAGVEVVKHALRSLWRAPALSVAVVLTLALGLGANVTMYVIIDRLLLSPPEHVRAPEQVRRIMIEMYSEYRGTRWASGTLAWPDVADLEASTQVDGPAVWARQQLTLGHGLEAREVDGVAVSGNYFGLIGAQPTLGRFIDTGDESADADPVAVISHEMWQREYGGRADVLGETLDFAAVPYTIVGVAPRGMTTLQLGRGDVWVPALLTMGEEARRRRNWYSFGAIARLKESADEAAAMAELTALHLRGRAEQIEADDYPADARVLLTPLLEARGPAAGAEARVAKWLAGVSLIVLLIACVNVANLMLARLVRQSREIAVRLALGISRGRLIGQLLLEGALLGVLGGAAALALASRAGPAMSTVLLPSVAWRELGWNTWLIPVALVAAALTGLIAVVGAALHASRRDPGATLRQAGAGAVTRSTAHTRTGLALMQAALCVVLLVGAGLFVRSLAAVRSVDLGLDLDGVFYTELTYRPGTTTAQDRTALNQAMLERLKAHPHVAAAAATVTPPFMGSMTSDVRLPGMDSVPRVGEGQIWMNAVTGDYFDVLRIPLIRGRSFAARETADDARVLVVNEMMARVLWPGRDPIGQCVYVATDTECSRVIGVARDTRQREFDEETSMQFYVPLSPRASGFVMVRPRPGRGAEVELVRAGLDLDARIRHVRITPAAERLAPQERSWRLGATLFTAFGALALIVAAFGLYALLAFDTSQRTHEIGVRRALGARGGSIIRLVLGRALALAVSGVTLGGLTAALLAPRLRDVLYEVSPFDPLTYAGAGLALLLTATGAAMLPALRAAAVDPGRALRAE